jgi:hypothetical protein
MHSRRLMRCLVMVTVGIGNLFLLPSARKTHSRSALFPQSSGRSGRARCRQPAMARRRFLSQRGSEKLGQELPGIVWYANATQETREENRSHRVKSGRWLVAFVRGMAGLVQCR